MVVSMWVRARGIHYNLPPQIICVLIEKDKGDTGLARRRYGEDRYCGWYSGVTRVTD